MKIRFIFLPITVVILITSCQLNKTSSYYDIWRNDDLTYGYEIRSGKGVVLAKNEMVLVTPDVTILGDSILRVELSQGSNALMIEYYNTKQGIKLYQCLTSGYYTDIYENGKLLIAFYDIVDEKTVLTVYDVIENKLIDIIDRDFFRL